MPTRWRTDQLIPSLTKVVQSVAPPANLNQKTGKDQHPTSLGRCGANAAVSHKSNLTSLL